MRTLLRIIAPLLTFAAGCGHEDMTNVRSVQPESETLSLAESESPAEATAASLLPRLAVGQALSIDVRSPVYWNFALQAKAGDVYTFSTPPDAGWTDYFIPTGPNGFATSSAPAFSQSLMKIMEPFRRLPHENWFVLSACVGFDPNGCFAVGAASTKRIDATGPLSFFANDVPGYYSNNVGSVRVTIRRDR